MRLCGIVSLLALGLCCCGVGLAFSPVQRHALLIPVAATNISVTRPVPTQISHNSLDREQRLSLFALQSTLTAAAWTTAHVVGGSLAAPIVAKAINRWYTKISLPSWTPPNRIFAPVWTLLYATMGVASFRIYDRVGALKNLPMILWGCHCLGNLLWAPVFFGFKKLRAGLLINCLLVASLAWILPVFYQIDRMASLLLLPYMIWLLFATTLNYAICKRNPTSQGYNDAMFQDDLAQLQEEAAKYADQ